MLFHDGVSCGALATTDRASEIIQEQQFALGEGPGLDACRTGQPVLEPDLAHPSAARWLAFTPQVVDAGVGAAFAILRRHANEHGVGLSDVARALVAGTLQPSDLTA